MNAVSRDSLEKIIKMTGERAKIDAKIANTYIVYKNKEGQTVREYANGNIVIDKGERNE